MMDYSEFEKDLHDLAETLDIAFEKRWGKRIGFALILFEFNEPGAATYLSNAYRADMIEALKETVKRLENKEDIPPAFPVMQ